MFLFSQMGLEHSQILFFLLNKLWIFFQVSEWHDCICSGVVFHHRDMGHRSDPALLLNIWVVQRFCHYKQ